MTKDPRKLTALGIPTTRANPIPASSFFAPVCSTPSTEPIAPQDGHEPRHCCTNTCSTSTPDHHTHHSCSHPPTRLPSNDPIPGLYSIPPAPRKQPRQPANTSGRISALTTGPDILTGPAIAVHRLPPKPHASPASRVQPQRPAARGSLPLE